MIMEDRIEQILVHGSEIFYILFPDNHTSSNKVRTKLVSLDVKFKAHCIGKTMV